MPVTRISAVFQKAGGKCEDAPNFQILKPLVLQASSDILSRSKVVPPNVCIIHSEKNLVKCYYLSRN